MSPNAVVREGQGPERRGPIFGQNKLGVTTNQPDIMSALHSTIARFHVADFSETHGTFTLETLHGASELPEVLSRPDGNRVYIDRSGLLAQNFTSATPPSTGLQPITARSINTEDFASEASAILRCNRERNMFN
ncbi:hypothetical protein QR685DRAFT_545717 [Neurospora intermedia]|uniref:Uncharacterized protein n=1 Tax=Neurospora intermedia TaxID=5142 RepID=A0ABR3D884_NEUIN